MLLLWAGHADEVVPGSPLPSLLASVIVGTGLTAIGTIAMRSVRRGALVGTAASLAVLGHAYVLPEWLFGPFGAALSVAVVASVAWRLRSLDDEAIARMTATANVIGVVAVAACSVAIVVRGSGAEASALELVGEGSDPSVHRDLVIIVPDRYGGPAALRTRFGIDDGGLAAALEQRGFSVGADVRANYQRTTHSLASQWNLGYLDDAVDDLPGSAAGAVTPLYPLLRDHALGRSLTARGYSYTHLGSWFGPTMTADAASDTRRIDGRSEFGLVVEWSSILPVLTGGEAIGTTAGRRERQVAVTTNQLDELEAIARELAADPQDPPRLVVAHVMLPHEPFVFRADGSTISAEEHRTRTYVESYEENYENQLRYFNDRLIEIVDILLSGDGSGNGPVVLVQADEGPHPVRVLYRGWSWSEATDDELVTKFSILSALHVPGGELELTPGTTAVNVARRAVGAALGVQLDELEDRSFVTEGEDRLYTFVDVTDRLDTAIERGPGR